MLSIWLNCMYSPLFSSYQQAFSTILDSMLQKLRWWVSFKRVNSFPLEEVLNKLTNDFLMTCRRLLLSYYYILLHHPDYYILSMYFHFHFHFPGMWKLEVSHNPVSTIPSMAFYGLERALWEVHLPHNKLTRIPSDSLTLLKKLSVLNLAGKL